MTENEILNSPTYPIAKLIILEKLSNVFLTNTSNIHNYRLQIMNRVRLILNNYFSNMIVDDNFDSNLQDFIDNYSKYIPNINPMPTEDKSFVESIKYILKNSEYSKIDNSILNVLQIEKESDIDNLKQLPMTFFYDSMRYIINGILDNILNIYQSGELAAGVFISVIRINTNTAGIGKNISKILNVSDLFINDFSDTILLNKLSTILTNLNEDINFLCVNSDGSLDIEKLLGNYDNLISIESKEKILSSIKPLSILLNNVLGQLAGSITGLSNFPFILGSEGLIGGGSSMFYNSFGSVLGSFGTLLTGPINRVYDTSYIGQDQLQYKDINTFLPEGLNFLLKETEELGKDELISLINGQINSIKGI